MKNSSSKQVQRKWADVQEKSCSPKSTAKNELKVPKKPILNCTGFTYCGAKLFVDIKSIDASYKASQMFCFRTQCIQNKTFETPCTRL